MDQPNFDAIRPYRDEEVAPVLHEWLARRELRQLVQRAGVSRLLNAPVIGPLVARWWLRHRFGRIQSVDELQHAIAPRVRRLFDSTTEAVTAEGLDRLPSDRPALFLSNHRDIVTDPAVVNYMLYERGFGTTRIAIGDNLTEEPLVSDLMRLNKSFIVRRNLRSPREMRDVYLTLSSYIRESIEQGQSVWLAQREGRAKDGIDVTDPAIIKMLYMSHKRDRSSLSEAIEKLRVIPVAVSYEIDPCDSEKARELEARDRAGAYNKRPGEDIESIIRGITGFKGRVHVAFGAPVRGDFDSPAAVAECVDQQIVELYRFFPINYAAAEKLVSRGELSELPEGFQAHRPGKEEMMGAHQWLDQRLRAQPVALHPYMLRIYANPLLRYFGSTKNTRTDRENNG